MRLQKLIRKVAIAVVGAGSSLVIAACYGAYYSMERAGLVQGRVTNENGAGVAGLEVCADVPGYDLICTETDSVGDYNLDAEPGVLDEADVRGFMVTVRDIDGYDNGLYLDDEVAVDVNSVPADVNIEVEAAE
jgi:hypothetical protein